MKTESTPERHPRNDLTLNISDEDQQRIGREAVRFSSGEENPVVKEVIRSSAEKYGLRRQTFIQSLEDKVL